MVASLAVAVALVVGQQAALPCTVERFGKLAQLAAGVRSFAAHVAARVPCILSAAVYSVCHLCSTVSLQSAVKSA